MTTEPTPIAELSKTTLTVIFGNPGSGKTTLAAKLGERNLFITDERGIVALNRFPDLAKRSSMLPFVGLNTIKYAVNKVAKKEWEYDHVVLDTMSGMQQERIFANMEELAKVLTGRNARTHNEIPEWPDYNLSLSQWRPVVRGLASCGVNVTLICHLRGIPTPRKPGDTVRPDLTDKVFQQVNRYANVMVMLEQDDKGNRVITTEGNNSLSVKCQITVPGSKITDEQFIEAVHNHRNS